MGDNSTANLVLALAVLGIGGLVAYELVLKPRWAAPAGPNVPTAGGPVAMPVAPAGAFFGFAPR